MTAELIDEKCTYYLIKLKYQEDKDNKGKAIFLSEKITEDLNDLGSAEGIKAMLKDIDYDNEQYKKRIISTFSHGFGYSIFNAEIFLKMIQIQSHIFGFI